MRLCELFLDEYTTKHGEQITFKISQDIEGDDNRGWIVHQIDAYVKQNHAGYLKISYIPKDRFDNWYPSIYNYLNQILGLPIAPKFEDRSIHYTQYNDKDLLKFYKNISFILFHEDLSMKQVNLTRKQLLDQIQIWEKQLNKKYKNRFDKFKKHFIDNPYVDYIKVFKTGDWPGREIQKKSKYDFQRQRIGSALYQKAANFLKQKGLMLRMSDTQSKDAKHIWSYLDRIGLVLHKNGYRYINPQKV